MRRGFRAVSVVRGVFATGFCVARLPVASHNTNAAAPRRPRGLMSTTSTSLLQRLRDTPDPRDWQRFVDLYRPFLLAFLRRQGAGDADAEDLAQEILAVVVRELPAFEHNRRPG